MFDLSRVEAPAGSARLEHDASRGQTGLKIAPQRHQELAGERHDGDAAHPPFLLADALTEPDAEGTAGLVAQPQPGPFNHRRTDQATARLADALVARDRPAGPWTRRDAGKAGELAAIGERPIEHLADQPGGKLRPDRAQLGQGLDLVGVGAIEVLLVPCAIAGQQYSLSIEASSSSMSGHP